MAEPSAAASAAVESKDDAEVEQPPVDAPIDANANSTNSVPLAALAVHNEAVQAAQHICNCQKAFEKPTQLKAHQAKCKVWKERPQSNEPKPKRARRATASAADVKDAPEEKCQECGSNNCVMTIVVGDVTKQLCQVCQKKRDEAMAAEAAPPKVTANKSGFKGKTLGVDFDIADVAFQDER
jgi:hypothetical protein